MTKMARYNLIMSDENYMKLMQIAVEQGITMGRLLNDIISNAVEGDTSETKEGCWYCGEPPKYRAFHEGKMMLICETHFQEHKKALSGWKVIE